MHMCYDKEKERKNEKYFLSIKTQCVKSTCVIKS